MTTSNDPSTTFGAYALDAQILGGGMAETWKATHISSGRTVFLKRVRTSSIEQLALDRERQIYEKLSRHTVVGLLAIEDSFDLDGFSAIVTQFAEGGDLDAHITATGRMSHESAHALAIRLSRTARELHAHNIVHRDIKPKNLLRADGDWMLADFGIAKNLSRLITQHTFQGAHSDWFAPPEQVRGGEAAPSADVFALGRIFLFTLTGRSHVGVDEIMDTSSARQWRNLITECTEENPTYRPSAAGILSRLEALF